MILGEIEDIMAEYRVDKEQARGRIKNLLIELEDKEGTLENQL
jgi:hypothetical protein